MLRTNALRGVAALWAGADANRQSIAYANSQANAVRGTTDWTRVTLSLEIPQAAYGVGVVPTVPVSPPVAGLGAGRDEVLERAAAVIQVRPFPDCEWTSSRI